MDISVLESIYEKGNYSFHDSFDNWQDAVTASIGPLIEKNLVKPEYAEKLVEMVKEYGPYICLMPHVCMPHAMAPECVISDDVCVSFMKVNKPVIFGDKEIEKSEIFFALAAPSGEKHLNILSDIAIMLEQEGLVEKLLEVSNEFQLEELIQKNKED